MFIWNQDFILLDNCLFIPPFFFFLIKKIFKEIKAKTIYILKGNWTCLDLLLFVLVIKLFYLISLLKHVWVFVSFHIQVSKTFFSLKVISFSEITNWGLLTVEKNILEPAIELLTTELCWSWLNKIILSIISIYLTNIFWLNYPFLFYK